MTVEGEIKNSENPLKNDKDAYSKTKFRVMSLYFPSDYNEEVLLNLMKASHSFHLYFERDANKPNDIKKGGLSLSFESEEAAKDAYVNARDKLINGTKIKLQGHKWFEQQYAVSLACDSSPTGSNIEIAKDADIDLVIPKDPNTHIPFVETVFEKESLKTDEAEADIDIDRKLFVSQLLPTTDQDLIFAVFGQENLQNVQINDENRKSDGTKSAILTFCSPELAEQSKQDYDGFVIDDGDMSKPMKITLYSEYLNRGSHKQDIAADTSNEIPNIDLNRQDTDVDKIEKVNGTLNIDDHKGKAGNLWSAQIVSNRSGDGAWDAIVKAETEISVKKPESHKTKNEENVRPVACHTKYEPQVDQSAQFSGELSESEISRLIDTYVEATRINYAELHSLEDLWSLVHDAAPMDKVGWQPEQSLKGAMMTSLQNALPFNDAHWWQNHIEFLIKLWKRELDLECRSKVRKQLLLAVEMEMPPATNGQQKPSFQSENTNIGVETAETTTSFTTVEHSSPTSQQLPQKSSAYVPPPASPKPKRKGAGKRALIELMGVGAFLASVQKEHAVLAPEKSSDDDQSGADEKEPSSKRKVPMPLASSSSAPAPKRVRERRSSSCESGEASSTSSEDGDGGKRRDGSASSDEDCGGPVHHKSRSKRRAAAVATASPPPPPPARNRSERRQQQQQRVDLRTHGSDHYGRRVVQQASELYSSQNVEHPATYNEPISQVPPPPPAQQQQQTWMTQMMPAMMQQFMPMMSQMFQNRMPAASAINTPQFQQQFMQLYQQIQSRIASGTMAASSAASALSSNPMFAQLAQRMGAAAASTSSATTAQQMYPQQQPPQQQQHQVPYGSAGLGPGYHYR